MRSSPGRVARFFLATDLTSSKLTHQPGFVTPPRLTKGGRGSSGRTTSSGRPPRPRSVYPLPCGSVVLRGGLSDDAADCSSVAGSLPSREVGRGGTAAGDDELSGSGLQIRARAVSWGGPH